MVVMSPWSSMPWNPATTGTIPAAMVSLSRWVSTAVIRARRWTLVVRTRIWLPVKERAGTPRSHSAIARREIDTCSPVASNTSISRGFGSRAMPAARSTSRSVESPIAETTTAM
jgi:hypothetical protein